MKTRDKIDEQVLPPGNAGPKHGLRRAASLVGAILVVALVVGASAVVFAQLSQQHKNQAALVATGNWVQVLNGYTLTSLAAVGGTPSILYACATHTQAYTPMPGVPQNRIGTASYTVLRSTDFGTHWQDVGGPANLGNNCQLAINPADSNDLYAVAGVQNNAQQANVLRHSTDGGRTWTTIQPTFNVQDTQLAPLWNVQQLSMVGNHLFGVQWFFRRLPPQTPQGTLPRFLPLPTRLVTSVDGGHTWTVLDNQLAAARQEARSYAVDPSNVSTIYELVGSSGLRPFAVAEPNDVLPTLPFGSAEDLYKTSDNGATWHLLLKGLPFGARVQVQLLRDNSQMIYAGGSITPVPYVPIVPGGKDVPTVSGDEAQSGVGSFHLHLSRDGGATWHDVPALPPVFSVQAWFAGGDGQVYVYTVGLYAHPGVQPTAIVGTAVPATPHSILATSVPQGSIPVTTGDTSIAYQPATTPTPGVILSPLASMKRYNPSTNSWGTLTTPPTNGALLALTPGKDTNGSLLWFMGTNKAQPALYRYIA
jgi:hypothetical protein